MVIRAWVEEGSSDPLRVQIRLTRDVSAGFEQSLAFADSDDVSKAVGAWLHDVLADDGPLAPLP
jgi:hypothetical protein